jgi:RNA polymerase sigma factor for flagellar operon FliA
MSVAQNAYKAQAVSVQRDQLIMEHLEFVRHILGRLISQLPPDVDQENLESAGILGLVEAAQHYDPQRGASFKTFAYTRIRGAILDELRRNSPLPQKVIQNITKIRRVSEARQGPISPEDLSQATELSLEEIEIALDAMRLSKFQRWEDPANMPNGVLDRRTRRPEAQIAENEMRSALIEAILKLPEKERRVLTLYYMEDLRLKEIGTVLSLSESRISRILSKAQFRLKQLLGSEEDLL